MMTFSTLERSFCFCFCSNLVGLIFVTLSLIGFGLASSKERQQRRVFFATVFASWKIDDAALSSVRRGRSVVFVAIRSALPLLVLRLLVDFRPRCLSVVGRSLDARERRSIFSPRSLLSHPPKEVPATYHMRYDFLTMIARYE